MRALEQYRLRCRRIFPERQTPLSIQAAPVRVHAGEPQPRSITSRRLDAALVIVTVPELGRTAQDHFLLNIMASFAESGREVIAARSAGARTRLEPQQRRLAGTVPFSYSADPRTRQLTAEPAGAAIVRCMFAEAAALELDLRRTAQPKTTQLHLCMAHAGEDLVWPMQAPTHTA